MCDNDSGYMNHFKKKNSQFDFVPRNTKKSKSLDLVDFGCVAILVEIFLLDQETYLYESDRTSY